MPARRVERLAEEIREEVARIVGRMKDPRLGFVTVTRVDLTADLRTARVLISILGDPKERAKSLGILRRASGFVRRQLGQRLNIRHTPEIVFQYDEGLDNSERVARLLDEVGTGGEEPSPEGEASPSPRAPDPLRRERLAEDGAQPEGPEEDE